MSDHEYMTYAQLSVMLNVPTNTLYDWVRNRRIPHHRFGPRTVRFKRDEILAWDAGRRVSEETRALSGGRFVPADPAPQRRRPRGK
jgi:excisionase family DNA binding protein